LEGSGWFQSRAASPLESVAYFSPEFGIAEALPQYSGGLGVLAGDHLKAASGLNVPLTGVGLLYRHAYFHQELDADGWQLERYPTLDPHTMPLELVDDVKVELDLAGTPLWAQVWRARVGRINLYLLDADVPGNDEPSRQVTDRLYGGDNEHRLRQEILLGMGGVRALAGLDALPQLFHMNEGHAGFCTLERIRGYLGEGLNFAEAMEAVRVTTVFTTHTPVPAGIDRFPRPLMERYFAGWADDCGLSMDELMALGHQTDDPPDEPFNMAVLGLRLSGMANGVSKLHAQVSRRMFHALWPGVPVDEVPIGAVTNGVHARTWVDSDVNDLLERRVLPEWPEASPDRWDHFLDTPDPELWRVRTLGRERLVAFVRARLRQSASARGESDVSWCDAAFDPTALTMVWARRFAAYKRATLLLSQPERLRQLLTSTERPVQIVFSGKAHPADDVGKQMIRSIIQTCRDEELRLRMAFVEDYDMAVARVLYQGADVWLNTPRRPNEACGTSGMKAALNGAINCSVLDGWFDELYNGENGWAILSAERHEDLARRDEAEASSLFDLLEHEILPLFYDRRSSQTPQRWISRIKASLGSLGPSVSASRMVREYVADIYEPLADRAAVLSANGFARAKSLAAWKEEVRQAWPAVKVEGVATESTGADLGAHRMVTATVDLGPLAGGDVAVQLLHGAVDADGELLDATTVVMRPLDGTHYAGTLTCDSAGRYGYTVRVVPSHPDLGAFAELGCVAWVDQADGQS
ncbi:MAG TPA: alpha-glucan family phosphorylase, partial [Acidimicrobiales bacterium]|nr:alpha-glucan family phosphorylase [Acidimicrobiales bacterium]